MGFVNRLYNNVFKRSVSNLVNPKAWLIDLLGNVNSAGANVNKKTALTLSAYWSAVRIISETMAYMPVKIFKMENDNRRIEDRNHFAYNLLNRKPNKIMDSFTWYQVMQANALNHGNGYSRIWRDNRMRPVELEFYENSSDVRPFIDINTKELFYDVKGETLYPRDIFHIKGFGNDGVVGMSILSYAREALGGGLAQQTYANKIFKSGGSKRLIAMSPGKMHDDTKKAFTDSWNDNFAGFDNIHKVIPLAGGVDLKEIGLSPEDAQLLTSRYFTIKEIARFTGIPLYLLQEFSENKYNSIEQLSLEYYKTCILPWISRWESEAKNKLFLPSEAINYEAEFDVNSLLRGDAKTRAEMNRIRFQSGSISPNEIRRGEGENPFDNKEADELWIMSNMMPISVAREYYSSKKNGVGNSDGKAA
jgi:HK97 family phage portal protein